MATNNNLQEVSLGAPAAIDISHNQYPHAALSVQTMERCGVLTLHDAADGTRCTEEGAMATAARLIAQLMHERSISASSEGWSITFDVWAMVDAAVHGGAEHPVQMALTGADGAAVCWAVEGDATPGVSLSADGVLTLPADCSDTLRIKAIRWDDRDVRAMVTIPVSAWREVADLLVQYPSLAAVLAERPALAAVVAEWPMVVNSLVETGKRNWLNGDGTAWLNTNTILPSSASMDFDMYMRLADTSGDKKDFGAVAGFRIGKNGTTLRIGYDWNGPTVQANKALHITFNRGVIAIDGNIIRTVSGSESKVAYMFAANGESQRDNCSFSNVFVDKDGEPFLQLVPFVRKGVNGMLDLLTNTFLSNANTSGQFTLTTEPA